MNLAVLKQVEKENKKRTKMFAFTLQRFATVRYISEMV